MNRMTMNKLCLTGGILLASNGALLAATPERFAALRTMRWLPDGVNARLRALARRDAASRATGAFAAVAGLLLLLLAVARTDPGAEPTPSVA